MVECVVVINGCIDFQWAIERVAMIGNCRVFFLYFFYVRENYLCMTWVYLVIVPLSTYEEY